MEVLGRFYNIVYLLRLLGNEEEIITDLQYFYNCLEIDIS